MRTTLFTPLSPLFLAACLGCGTDDDGAARDTRDTSTAPDAITSDVTAPDTSRPDSTLDSDSPETTSPETRDPSCGARECGPAPGTFVDCGTCAALGRFACNDGVCEATCDPVRCERMSWVDDSCFSSGECDASPDGVRTSATYTCSGDRAACGAVFDQGDCPGGDTECRPCDLSGTDDGRCHFDECMPALAVDCPEPACADRECGPHPVTHEDCGACSGELGACNDGRCEATCDAAACARMGFSVNGCVPASECDGSPEGAVLETTYACSASGATCEMALSAVDCGAAVTDCRPCDFAGSDDGRCEDDACVPAADTTCPP